MNIIFSWIGNIINKFPKTILITSMMIFIFLITGAVQIKMATGNETLVKTDNEVYQSNKEMEDRFGGDSILIILNDESAGGFLLENIRGLWEIEKELHNNDDIFSIMSVTSIINQMIGQQSNNQMELPANQMMLNQLLYLEDGKVNPLLKDVMLNPNQSLMVIKLVGNLSDETKEEVVEEVVNKFENTSFELMSYTISGKPVLDISLRAEMQKNMAMMVALAVIVMFFVLMLVFKVRGRMLSLGVIFISVITTLGLMGYVGVHITMVSMAVFPILIGLGIDYSIQFHNRFEEDESAYTTIKQTGKAILIAVIATILGFVSLFVSPVPMIKDFGLMLTIGVVISFIGGLFILMPILRLRRKKNIKHKNVKILTDTKMEKGLEWVTKKILKFGVLILIITLILSSLGFVSDQYVGVETDVETFMPQDMEALEDIHYVRETVGSTDQIIIYLKDDNIVTETNIKWIQMKTSELKEKYIDIIIDIQSVDSLIAKLAQTKGLNSQMIPIELYLQLLNNIPSQQFKMFITDSNEEAILLLKIKHISTAEMQEFIADLNNDVNDSEMNVEITGKAVLDVVMVNGLTSGRILMTALGLLLIVIFLLIFYRNFLKALIPIIPVILIIGISSGLMFLLDIDYTPITATLGALVLGMGTEMTIMLMERYLEEREFYNKQEAMIIAVKRIGKAILASGLTTVGGFSVLIFSKFVILQDFGLMTVINIILVLLSTFIVLPPLIILFDKLIYKDKKELEP